MIRLFYCWLLVSLINADPYHPRNKRPTSPLDTIYPPPVANEDKDYWIGQGAQDIINALNQAGNINTNLAKNVIIFLGDGMGFSTITPARIYNGQKNGFSGEESSLSFEDFPNIALSKTYSIDYQVTDSAASATAYLSGIKTNKGLLGVDMNVQLGDCSSMSDEFNVFSIAKWSQDEGKRTGLVTTTRVTHATPAGLYAHSADRDWESDTTLPFFWETNCPNLKDIARQLVEDDPGINMNVIMGGGYEVFSTDAVDSVNDPVDDDMAARKDGRNLMDEWLQAKLDDGETAATVRNRTQLMQQDFENLDFLFGIFANSHLPYSYLRQQNNLDIPTLSEMAEIAIKVLDKGTEGYFLLVEGGKIDLSHHNGLARSALEENIDLDAAVKRTLEIVDLNNTLIIVTADHSHTFGFAGYAARGNTITGVGNVGSDDIPYTTLLYANGPGYDFTVVDGEVSRPDPTNSNTSDFEYVTHSGIPENSAAHGGEDVPIYAIGPWAHLFYKVHENTFIANVMSYASCVGPYRGSC